MRRFFTQFSNACKIIVHHSYMGFGDVFICVLASSFCLRGTNQLSINSYHGDSKWHKISLCVIILANLNVTISHFQYYIKKQCSKEFDAKGCYVLYDKEQYYFVWSHPNELEVRFWVNWNKNRWCNVIGQFYFICL